MVKVCRIWCSSELGCMGSGEIFLEGINQQIGQKQRRWGGEDRFNLKSKAVGLELE